MRIRFKRPTTSAAKVLSKLQTVAVLRRRPPLGSPRTTAKVIPRGSTSKAIASPGATSSSVKPGRAPAITSGTMPATVSASSTDATRVTPSRWFGRGSDITISPAAANGSASATATALTASPRSASRQLGQRHRP